MRDAARALDDVSDHLGEVLRHADELLVEWSQFGARVRTAVDAEVAGIAEVVDGAVLRAAQSGVDRAIVDRLRGLSAEIERIEQRTRAAARAAADQRAGDRRLLWGVIAGIVLSNALLVMLVLRRPEPAPAPAVEPVRAEVAAPAAAPSPVIEPAPVADPAAGSATEPAAAAAPDAIAAPSVESAGSGSAAAAHPAAAGASSAAVRTGAAATGGGKPNVEATTAARPTSGVSLPRPVGAHTHKKW